MHLTALIDKYQLGDEGTASNAQMHEKKFN
jgi:hypothetical protein